MKPKQLIIILSMLACIMSEQLFAQVGISNISINSIDLSSPNPVLNRKGAGVKSVMTGLDNRWDSIGTNFALQFNAGVNDSIYIDNVNISSLGNGSRLSIPAIAKVRRVANSEVSHTGNHCSYFLSAASFPSTQSNTGSFLLNAPEINLMEDALISNNINAGIDNIFQNNSNNVHYGNIERIDYIFPDAYLPEVGQDLTKIGFTIYDRGNGDAFKIAGISNVDPSIDPSVYITPLRSVNASNFGSNLLSTNNNFAILQIDPLFNGGEARPSVVINENMRGVFISFADLGFVVGQKCFGFSLFANDVNFTTSNALVNFQNFPTNSDGTDMLDLVNSIGVYSFNRNTLASSTILKATKQNNSVLLKWNAESLDAANQVYLQKSTDNRVYTNIKTIANYESTYTDVSENIISSYYRLMIVKNGITSYSNIQFIQKSKNKAIVFPNVTSGKLNISSSEIIPNKIVTLSIYNQQGKLCYATKQNGNSFISLDVANLSSGMYILTVSQEGVLICNEKFIKN
jgi:Secretion system C-terminal sorting domain